MPDDRSRHRPDQGPGDPAFRAWRDRLRSFELDGERLYLPTGDVPMDEQQLADYWATAVAPARRRHAPPDS